MDYARDFYSQPSRGSFAAIYATRKYPGNVLYNVSCPVEIQRRKILKALLASIDLSKGRNKLAVMKKAI